MKISGRCLVPLSCDDKSVVLLAELAGWVAAGDFNDPSPGFLISLCAFLQSPCCTAA